MSYPVSDQIEEARLDLGRQLRRFRKNQGLTATELARRARMSVAKVSRIENGLVSATDVTLRRLAIALQLDDDDTRNVMAYAEIGRRLRTQRASNPRNAHVGQATWADLERHATSVESLCSTTLPVLLHTPSYSRALLDVHYQFSGWDEVYEPESNMAIRLRRQAELFNPQRRFAFVIEERALRAHVLSHGEMATQMDHLLHTAALPAVEVQVMAGGDGLDRGYCSADSTVAAVDVLPGVDLVVRPSIVLEMERHFASMRKSALSTERSMALIRSVRDEFRREPSGDVDLRGHEPSQPTTY